ncbi:MAG: hypothetical protein AB3N24_08005 [Leisingera sp.]
MSDTSGMTEDQRIFNEIAQVLGRIAPASANEMIFRGKIYDDYSSGLPAWVDTDGNETVFGADGTLPLRDIGEILDLAEELLETPIFKANPFNQFEIRINRELDLKVTLADIPKSQTWNNLFMRPVSDLTEMEAEQFDIPTEDWAACVAAADELSKGA